MNNNSFFWNPQDDAERIQAALLRSPVTDRRMSIDDWVAVACGVLGVIALVLVGWIQ